MLPWSLHCCKSWLPVSQRYIVNNTMLALSLRNALSTSLSPGSELHIIMKSEKFFPLLDQRSGRTGYCSVELSIYFRIIRVSFNSV